MPPLLAGAVEKLDDLRDFFRDYDDRRVEELREYLVSSDIWTEEPRVLRPSLTFISRYGESPLVRVGGLGLEPVVLTPQRLNEQAVGLSGSAIIRVGRVAEFRQRTSDSLDYMYEEVRLVDREGGNVWGGIGSVSLPSVERGDVVIFRGVVAAFGPIGEGANRSQVGYFVALSEVDYPGAADASREGAYSRPGHASTPGARITGRGCA